MLAAVAAIVLGAGVYWTTRGERGVAAPKARILAPDFTLPQPGGPPLTLSAYQGKVVLLDFWATWCYPCREEIPHFVEFQQKYGERGLQVMGVSMDDSPEPVPAFYQQYHMNYPVVMGNAKIGEAYGGLLGLPITFLLDREGRITAKHIGATDAAVFEREIQRALNAAGSRK
ncbi:MAG TPA: TlpA disulfide reductase family protein [Candidatus Sulfotelmatobacter sp.]|nr:TlpA disulfide reductase family protein [Candidatus Sulfotelmatobacter sp.]